MDLLPSTPNYTMIEAAMYARVSLSTLRYWTKGRRGTPPVIRTAGGMLSFVNLVEVHMIGMFRGKHGVPLPRIRRAISAMADRFPDPHPLTTQKFWTDGRDILTRELDGGFVSLVDHGQRAFSGLVEDYLERVVWAGNAPTQFYPWTVNAFTEGSDAAQRRSVVVDPAVSFGRAVVTGTRVTTKAIKDLWDVGTDIQDIAREFDVEPLQAQDAVRLEEARSSLRRAG